MSRERRWKDAPGSPGADARGDARVRAPFASSRAPWFQVSGRVGVGHPWAPRPLRSGSPSARSAACDRVATRPKGREASGGEEAAAAPEQARRAPAGVRSVGRSPHGFVVVSRGKGFPDTSHAVHPPDHRQGARQRTVGTNQHALVGVLAERGTGARGREASRPVGADRLIRDNRQERKGEPSGENRLPPGERGVGDRCWPSSRRSFHSHGQRMCQNACPWGGANTSGRDRVRDLPRHAPFHRTPDAETDPVHLLGHRRGEAAWGPTVQTPTRHAARQAEAWCKWRDGWR